MGGGNYGGALANSATLVINSSSNQTFAGAMSGTGTVFQLGSGATTLSGASITYTGSTTVTGGRLILYNATAYDSPTTVSSAGSLSWSGNTSLTTAAVSTALNNGGTLENLNPANWTVVNGAVTNSGATTINESSNATAGSGEGLLPRRRPEGRGHLTINAANAGSGVNFRNNNTTFAGTLVVNGISSTTAFAGSGIGVGGCTTGLANADITVNGTMELLNQGIGWANSVRHVPDGRLERHRHRGRQLHRRGGGTTLTLGTTNNSGSFSGTIANGVGDTLYLVKTGSGMQTLSGPNTYSGNTTITPARSRSAAPAIWAAATTAEPSPTRLPCSSPPPATRRSPARSPAAAL